MYLMMRAILRLATIVTMVATMVTGRNYLKALGGERKAFYDQGVFTEQAQTERSIASMRLGYLQRQLASEEALVESTRLALIRVGRKRQNAERMRGALSEEQMLLDGDRRALTSEQEMTHSGLDRRVQRWLLRARACQEARNVWQNAASRDQRIASLLVTLWSALFSFRFLSLFSSIFTRQNTQS